MPAHSVLTSLAQGLPSCATATEADSSAANITSPDRIPDIFRFLSEFKKRGMRIYLKASSDARTTQRSGRYWRFVKILLRLPSVVEVLPPRWVLPARRWRLRPQSGLRRLGRS